MDLVPTSLAFLSGMDYVVILFICLLLFGAKRLPELARSLGSSIREFKKAATDVEENFRVSIHEDERKKAPAPSNGTAPAPAAAQPGETRVPEQKV